jgi:type II secretory pathway pseudopilin PulG
MSPFQRGSRVKNKAYTLIESLIVGALLVVIIGAMLFFLTTSEMSNSVNSAKLDLESKVRTAINWIIKDTRETSLIQINNNDPGVNHIKFKKVTGIDLITGNYTLSDNYIEYVYDQSTCTLTRNQIHDNTVLKSWVFTGITQLPFYVDPGVPLEPGNILTAKKLLVLISGQSIVKNSLALNFTLTEEVKIRNE